MYGQNKSDIGIDTNVKTFVSNRSIKADLLKGADIKPRRK